MSKQKRNTKSASKTQTNKLPEHPLTHLLLAKHTHHTHDTDHTSATALVLQSVLSGSDQELQEVLEKWDDLASVEQIVGSWVISSANLLLTRLITFLQKTQNQWAYPWIKAALKRNCTLNPQDEGVLRHALSIKKSRMQQMLALSGKLQLFDF